LIRRNGKLTPSTWEDAFELIGKHFAEIRDRDGGSRSASLDRTALQRRNYVLSKFARAVLKETMLTIIAAQITRPSPELSWQAGDDRVHARSVSTLRQFVDRNDPTNQHPLLAYQTSQ